MVETYVENMGTGPTDWFVPTTKDDYKTVSKYTNIVLCQSIAFYDKEENLTRKVYIMYYPDGCVNDIPNIEETKKKIVFDYLTYVYRTTGIDFRNQ